jgi:siroheme synthase-like protein
MILECRNLTKTYRGKKAVSDLSIRLDEGKIYGLLGENGSGKTTWMKMAAGLTKPTQGEILYKEKTYSREDLYDADLVIAATDNKEVNEDIYSACKCLGIQVNVASDQKKCDFHFPGVLEYDGVVMGFNGGGKDHRKVRQVREKVQEALLEDKGEV